MKRSLLALMILIVVPAFAYEQVQNCHIEIMKDDASKYVVKAHGSICIKYGTFTGEIILEDLASLEIGPEATFSGRIHATKSNSVLNKGTWRAPLHIQCRFDNMGAIYAHELEVKSHGYLQHIGPAKIIVDQNFTNYGNVFVKGLIEIGGELHNHHSLVMESAIISAKGNIFNKGSLQGSNEFLKLSSIRTDRTLTNEGSIGGPLQFFDLCAAELNNTGNLHPRVSQCASAPNILASQWLQIDGYTDATLNKLNWYTAESNTSKVFVVQKSDNGREFSNIAVIENGKEVNPSIFHYSFQDRVADIQQDVYYRIMEVQKSGSVSYSEVVALRALVFTRTR